jgi:uncharacterized membrane protein
MKNIGLLMGMAFIMVLASCTETTTTETIKETNTTEAPAQSSSTTVESNNDGTSVKVSSDGFELDTKDGESGTEIKVKVK